MYAIIQTGGKQYRVGLGDVVDLEHLDGSVGQTVTFDKVLLVGGKADSQVLVGAPYVAKATLQGEIVEQGRGEKLLTIKYRRRKGYRRMIGHRQEVTRVLVTKLEDGSGQSIQVDTAKRTEALRKASVPFSTRQKTKEAAPTKRAASGEAKAAAPKKAASTSAKTTGAKKATSKKA